MAEKKGFEPLRAFYTPTPLAGEPLRPLGYFSESFYYMKQKEWRREWDSNPRPVSGSPVFKTGSLNRSDISPYLFKLNNSIMSPLVCQQILFGRCFLRENAI